MLQARSTKGRSDCAAIASLYIPFSTWSCSSFWFPVPAHANVCKETPTKCSVKSIYLTRRGSINAIRAEVCLLWSLPKVACEVGVNIVFIWLMPFVGVSVLRLQLALRSPWPFPPLLHPSPQLFLTLLQLALLSWLPSLPLLHCRFNYCCHCACLCRRPLTFSCFTISYSLHDTS